MPTGNLSDIVRRIPIFQNFDTEQIVKTLEICQEQTFRTGDPLFKEGDASTEMHILLSGCLQIRTQTGSEIAVIGEMGLVGEMGALTKHPRSATVIAQQPSTTLSIPREALFRLIDTDRDMGFKIFQNITHILCERLRDNNILLEQQYLILEDLTGDDTDA